MTFLTIKNWVMKLIKTPINFFEDLIGNDTKLSSTKFAGLCLIFYGSFLITIKIELGVNLVYTGAALLTGAKIAQTI